MAGIQKDNAFFFSHDADMRNDRKIIAVRSKFGLTGYAVWNIILEVLTDSDHFCYELTEINKELLAGEIGIELELLEELIKYFLKIGLVQIKDDFLYTKEHKKRLNSVLKKREAERERYKQKKAENGIPEAEIPKDETFLPHSATETENKSGILPQTATEMTHNRIDKNRIDKNIYIPENLKIPETDKKIFTSANWKPFVQNSKNLEQAIKFSLWFRDKIISDRLTPTKKQIQNWVTDYVILVEKKNKPPKQIAKVCEWAKNDEFWAKQINSASKLLRKDKDGYLYFDVLVSKLEDKKKDETQVVEAVNVL